MVDDPQNAKQLESRLRSACMRVTTLLGQGTAWPAQVVLQQFPELAESEESAIEIIYTEFQTLEELGQRPDVQQWLQNYPAYRQRLQRLIKLHDLLDEPSASDSPSMTSPKVDGRLDTIGNYELLEELGRGGMGVVYRARQRGLSRHVAVKILKSDDDLVTSRWRFQQEAESIAALQHPHVVQVFETGTDGERDYLSMELIEGGSLDTWM